MIRLLNKIPGLSHRLASRLEARPIRTTVRSADRFLINVDTADFIQRTIYLTGDWDETVSEVLRARLKPGGTFIDAGANVGFFSLLAAKLVGPSGRVISFEPNPAVFAQLQSNAALNGFAWIDAHQKGLFDREGNGTMFVPDTNCGAGTMRPGGDNGVAISLVRMDDIVKGEIDLLKIDVEGAEVAALRGAQRVLSGCPAVVCEISEYSLRAMGSSHYELYDLMAGLGFSPQIISPIRRSNLFKDRVFFQYDVLFTKTP